MRKRSWWILAASLLLCGAVCNPAAISAEQAVPAPLSLMVVGDSISQGSSGDFTWRYRLDRHLTAAGTAFELVGPRTDLFDNLANAQDDDHSYADPVFDQHHDAIWGRTLRDAAATIQAEVATANPDVLLVLLGINDLAFGVSNAAGAEASLRSLIANARAAKPSVRIAIGKLLPSLHRRDDAVFDALVREYNDRIVLAAGQLSTANSPVVVAESGQDIDPMADLWDGTHPNARGEVKIAAGFADALASLSIGAAYPRPYPAVPLGPRTPPVLSSTSNGGGTATLTWTPSAGATGYYVYTRDITAGETTLTQLPWAVPAPSWTGGLLAAGATYEYQLEAIKGNTRGVRSNLSRVTVVGTTPKAVTTLRASPGDHQATLSWTSVADATGYLVYVRNVNAGETSFTQLPYPVPGPTWVAAQALAGVTYEFRVQAINGYLRGELSNVASVTATGPTPGAVTDLSASPRDHGALLSWTPVAGATGYFVYVKNVSGGETTFTQLPYPVVGPTWTAELLAAGGTYEFQLQAVDDAIRGALSNVVRLTVSGNTPAAVTNLTAAPGNKQVVLSWTPPAGASAYYVYVKNMTARETSFTQLPWPVTGSTWTAAQALAGGTYQFQLQSVDGYLRGGFSNVATATVGGATPGVLQNLIATPGNRKVTLSWSAVPNATGYLVSLRRLSAPTEAGYTEQIWPVTGTSWVVSSLAAGGIYSFRMRAVNDYLRGGFSAPVEVTVGGVVPGAPIITRAESLASGQVTLFWNPVPEANAYWIWMRNRSAGEINFTKLRYPALGTTFVGGLFVPGGKYDFLVQSVNGYLDGASASTPVIPIAGLVPVGVTQIAATFHDGQVNLSWTPVAIATGYYVLVTNFKAGWRPMTRLPYPVVGSSFTYQPVFLGERYEFAVIAINGYLESAPSPKVALQINTDSPPPPFNCHFKRSSDPTDQDLTFATVGSPMPATLFNLPADVWTDRFNAAAFTSMPGLGPGDYIIIDRTIERYVGPGVTNPGHDFIKQPVVETKNLGWESCGAVGSSIPTTGPKTPIPVAKSPTIDGSYHAVRPCVVHNSEIQCSEDWYVDYD